MMHEANFQSLSLSPTMLCIERSCGNPGVPDNGEKNSSSYKYGNVVSFSCNVGYNMQGSQVRTCQTNAEWTGTQPTCLSKLELFCVVLFSRKTVHRRFSFATGLSFVELVIGNGNTGHIFKFLNNLAIFSHHCLFVPYCIVVKFQTPKRLNW